MRTILLALLLLVPAASGAASWGNVEFHYPPKSPWVFAEDSELSGRPATQRSLERLIEEILASAGEDGYPFATVRVESVDEVDGAIHLVLAVDPGELSILEGIILDGGGTTKPSTAMHLAGFRAGMRYSGREPERLKRALLSSGLFIQVDEVRVLPGVQSGGVVLAVNVSEPAYTQFSGAAGLGRDKSLTGMIDLNAMNLGGTAREGAARWDNRGGGLTRYFLKYKEPWLPVVPMSLEAALTHDINASVYSFTRWELQGNLKVNYHWFLTVGAGGTRSVELAEDGGHASETYGALGAGFDTRDHPLTPASGFRIQGETRRGRKRLSEGVELHRTRWSGDADAYRRVGSRWMSVLGLSLRHLDSPEPVIPIYDLYPIGGAASVRGYREEQFHTDLAVLWKTEWRWLQDLKGSALYGFVDGGWIAGRRSDGTLASGLDTMLLGYGLGVRQAAKAGLFGVEYAVAKGESVLEGRVHLRVAAAF